ncbi:MAG: DNA mismatch repair endonuclease MutL, partial [Spirochaetales bacterium]|nr:DNA mismatch repair endonuclease MutL [Spirochaetales bacterium]
MRIQRLDPLVAQRIAAGEVIERPASVIRELVDNALDAGASTITVSVEEGGLRQIKVIDDGVGIEAEDLPLLCESHATSKVRELDDLYHITSMGFRGEALYSIAAVARITIESVREGKEAHQITVDNGRRGPVLAGGPDRGTIVTVEELFGELPARRQFLKRPSTEATMARQILIQKALAFPDRSFRFYQDGKLRLDLPTTTPKGRVVDVLAINQPVTDAELVELHHEGERVSLYAVASTAALFRSDRSHIRIYINDRPVDEYALVQAVTYGYGEQLPGGSFPYCYLFIQVDPTLVDFNIHPTKREVKLRNQAEIHHLVVQMIRAQMKRTIPRISPTAATYEPKDDLFGEKKGQAVQGKRAAYTPQVSRTIDPQWFEKARQILGEESKPSNQSVEPPLIQPAQVEQPFVYLGQAFNLFLIAQKGEEIYLVDQHAAHERLLFDEVRSKHVSQPLLVPLRFEVSRDVDEYLDQHTDLYLNLGIKVQRTDEALLWELTAVPALYKQV